MVNEKALKGYICNVLNIGNGNGEKTHAVKESRDKTPNRGNKWRVLEWILEWIDRFDVVRKMSAKFGAKLKMYASRVPNFAFVYLCVDNEAINGIQNAKIKTTKLQIGRPFLVGRMMKREKQHAHANTISIIIYKPIWVFRSTWKIRSDAFFNRLNIARAHRPYVYARRRLINWIKLADKGSILKLVTLLKRIWWFHQRGWCSLKLDDSVLESKYWTL